MFIYVVIGYAIDPDDVLMIDKDFSFLSIILAIITLFHGISSGIFAMLIFAIVMKYFYIDFKYFYYLKEFILIMIYGEFHFYWTSIINRLETEDHFKQHKLSELSKAFFMLKISYDQIEKSYVVKPMSLRNSIIKIKEHYKKEDSSSYYKEFLHLLQKTLHIDSAFLVKVENESDMKVLAQTSDNDTLDIKDLLIQDSYTKQMPLYVSLDSDYEESSYLASIPIVSKNRTIGLLIIAKMPFMSFNKDNLISATILSNYMFDEIDKMDILEQIDNFLPLFQSNFRFETYRLYKLNEKFNTDTTMLLFKSYNKLSIHLLIEIIEKNLRVLDIMSHIAIDDYQIVAVLFPFSDKTSTIGFIDRIYSIANIKEHKESIMHTSISIKDIELIEEYIKSDS
jgi:hypothetical protein